MSSKRYTFVFSWETEYIQERQYLTLVDLNVGQMVYQYQLMQNSNLKDVLVRLKVDKDCEPIRFEPIRYDTWFLAGAKSNAKLCRTCELIMEWYLYNISLELEMNEDYKPLPLEDIAELILTRKICGLRYE